MASRATKKKKASGSNDVTKTTNNEPLLLYFSEEDGAEKTDTTNNNDNNNGDNKNNNNKISNSERRIRSDSESTDSISLASMNQEEEKQGEKNEQDNEIDRNYIAHILREKNADLNEKCERLERQKKAAVELLGEKKKQLDEFKERYLNKKRGHEEEVATLKEEKDRLIERLGLSQEERLSVFHVEKQLTELRRRLEESEMKVCELCEENHDLRLELKESRLEMEEMHDQFKDDEALEFRELQKELEATAKNCRILQFKLKKVEKRCETLEMEKRLGKGGERRGGDGRVEAEEEILSQGHMRRHIMEVEEELKMAKEVSVRLHERTEVLEEQRHKYEQEIDRLNGMLAGCKEEMKRLMLENKKNQTNRDESCRSAESSQVTSLMRDLNDSLEREHDLKEQLKFSEEEIVFMRKKMSDLEEELEAADTQAGGEKKEVCEDQDLKLLLDLAQSEVRVLRRRVDEMDVSYEVLLKEVKTMRTNVTKVTNSDFFEAGDNAGRTTHNETVLKLARDIDKLKTKLIERNQYAARDSTEREKISKMIKSKSLDEDDEEDVIGRRKGALVVKRKKTDETRLYVDARIQVEVLEQEMDVLKERLAHLQEENKRLHESGSQGPVLILKEEISKLKAVMAKLEESLSKANKSLLKCKLKIADGDDEANVDIASIKTQVQEMEEEMRKMRKVNGDLKAENIVLKSKIDHKLENNLSNNKSDKISELEENSRKYLIERVLELGEVIKAQQVRIESRDNENERLLEEVAEEREDLSSLVDAFKRREVELLEELDRSEKKHQATASLLALVTERADSNQKELETLQRKTSQKTEVANTESVLQGLKDVNKQLKVSLEEERTNKNELEKKLREMKMQVSSAPQNNNKDDDLITKERNQCQKELSHTLEVIAGLKRRLQEEKQGHQNLKAESTNLLNQINALRNDKIDLEANMKLLEKVPHQPSQNSFETEAKQESSIASSIKQQIKEQKLKKAFLTTTNETIPNEVNTDKNSKEPLSWRWEKQELEKQLKEMRKRNEENQFEMRKVLNKWKTASEDIEREKQIKTELEKKANKVMVEYEKVERKMEQLKNCNENKITKLEADLRKVLKENEDIEKEIKSLNELIASKEEILKQQTRMLQNKDKTIKDNEKALKEFSQANIDLEMSLKDYEVKIEKLQEAMSRKEDEISLAKEYKVQVEEQERKLKQSREQIAGRDERIKEKDNFLQELNKKLIDKGNQVNDMDKTIRQVIRKLQARDCDIAMNNAEVRKYQNELKVYQEKLQESKSKIDALEKKLAEKLPERPIHHRSDSKHTRETLLKGLESHKASETNGGDVDKELSYEKEEKLKVLEQFERFKRASQLQISSLEKQLQRCRNDVKKNTDNTDNTPKKTGLIISQKLSRPETLSFSKHPNIPSEASLTSSTTDAEIFENHLVIELEKKLSERELSWKAEKSALEEFYEVQNNHLRESNRQMVLSNQLLRKETDSLLLQLQTTRKLLADLRQRFDLQSVTWNEEKDTLQAKLLQLEDIKEQLKQNERSLDEATIAAANSEAKKNEMELSLNLVESEKETLEKEIKFLKKQKEPEGSQQCMPSDISPPRKTFTKVSEFKARFERFSRGIKKVEEPRIEKKNFATGSSSSFVDKSNFVNLEQLVTKLRNQIQNLETKRSYDEERWKTRLKNLNVNYENDLTELRRKTSAYDMREKEFAKIQKLLSDLQFRFVEDSYHWQTEKAQLQTLLDTSRSDLLRHKEEVTGLVAEVKRMQVLSSELGSNTQEESHKVRSRSLTPTAEKMRLLGIKERANQEKTDPNFTKTKVDDEVLMKNIKKAIESVSKMATNLTSPPTTFSSSRQNFLQSTLPHTNNSNDKQHKAISSSFKRSNSTIEVTKTVRTTTTSRMQRSEHDNKYDDYPSVFYNDNTSYSEEKFVPKEPETKSNRNSTYLSGSQSAYASRETSPACEPLLANHSTLPRKCNLTANLMGSQGGLPKAPPSMIITPSHTPKRAMSVERGAMSETKVNSIYKKLEAILIGEEKLKEKKRSDKEKGDTPRCLENDGNSKKLLGDSATNKNTSELNIGSESTKRDVPNNHLQMRSRLFGDKKVGPRSASVSPKTARKQFYDNYDKIGHHHKPSLQTKQQSMFSLFQQQQTSQLQRDKQHHSEIHSSQKNEHEVKKSTQSFSALHISPPSSSKLKNPFSQKKSFFNIFSKDFSSKQSEPKPIPSAKDKRGLFSLTKPNSLDSSMNTSAVKNDTVVIAAPLNFKPSRNNL